VSGADSLTAELLATLSNATLKLDPLTEPRLRQIEGQSLRFEVSLPGASEPLSLLMTIDKASLQFTPDDDRAVHAIVQGSPGALLAWLGSGRPDNIRFSGDELLLERLSDILSKFEPDLADPLGRLIGTEAATGLVGFAEAIFATGRSALEAASNAAGRSAREQYAENSEFDNAVEMLEALQLKVDRLQARATRLETSRESDPATDR
jgi:ubiquinone biosynthesis protein UbiJ